MSEKVVKSDKEWTAQLEPEPFHVLREQGTERAFSGKYWNSHAPVVYRCAGCGLDLFHGEDQYDSGTGWPSFFKPLAGAAGTWAMSSMTAPPRAASATA